MTREEATDILIWALQDDTLIEGYQDKLNEALKMAINALKREVLIIRPSILMKDEECEHWRKKILEELDNDGVVLLPPYLEVIQLKPEKEEGLPPVTQKSGKWLITPMSNIAYCSECDFLFKDIPASIVKHFKHCPNCGCRMESEG